MCVLLCHHGVLSVVCRHSPHLINTLLFSSLSSLNHHHVLHFMCLSVLWKPSNMSLISLLYLQIHRLVTQLNQRWVCVSSDDSSQATVSVGWREGGRWWSRLHLLRSSASDQLSTANTQSLLHLHPNNRLFYSEVQSCGWFQLRPEFEMSVSKVWMEEQCTHRFEKLNLSAINLSNQKRNAVKPEAMSTHHNNTPGNVYKYKQEAVCLFCSWFVSQITTNEEQQTWL